MWHFSKPYCSSSLSQSLFSASSLSSCPVLLPLCLTFWGKNRYCTSMCARCQEGVETHRWSGWFPLSEIWVRARSQISGPYSWSTTHRFLGRPGSDTEVLFCLGARSSMISYCFCSPLKTGMSPFCVSDSWLVLLVYLCGYETKLCVQIEVE